IKEKPDWSIAHFQLGYTLLLQQQADAALKAFDQAERLSGDGGQTRLRVIELLLALGKPDLAIEHAKSLLNNPATAAAGRVAMVQAYLAKQQPEQAERVLRDAVTAAPQDAVALVQLGRFQLDRRRPREALAQFDRAVAVRADAAEPLVAKANSHVVLGEPT